MKNWLKLSLITIILAVIIHLSLVIGLPSMVMYIAHWKMVKYAGGVNVVMHSPPTTAAHPVVNSSPDILYSSCAFDLSRGPLRFRAQVPDTYWSISGFDAQTNNFFAINDEQVQSKTLELVLVGPNQSVKINERAQVVKAPSIKGVILFRTFVPTADKLAGLIKTQRNAICSPYR